MVYLLCLLLGFVDTSHLKQGLVALNHGDLQQAQQELEQAGEEEPKNPFVWISLAETYLRLNELEKAEAAASKSRGNESGGGACALDFLL